MNKYNIAEITYNPYVHETKILVNGNPLSEYSKLYQFFKDELCLWVDKLTALLYHELNSQYVIVFQGRDIDSEIMRYYAEKDSNCLAYRSRDFSLDISFQDRMKMLESIIEDRNLKIIKQYMSIDIVLSECNDKAEKVFKELDIENSFFKAESHINKNGVLIPEKYSFVWFNNYETALNFYSESANQVFILYPSDKNQLTKIKNRCFYYGVTDETINTRIQNCLLIKAFNDVFIEKIADIAPDRETLLKLTAIEPELEIDIPSLLEIGVSYPLKYRQLPDNGKFPEIGIKCNRPGSIELKHNCIIGLSEGISEISMFKYGELFPFFKQEIKVIARNKISKIITSVDSLRIEVGETFRLSFDVIPNDPDNYVCLEYCSSDESIASISNDQVVYGKSLGKCDIIYSAGKVSSKVKVEVLPRLSDFIIVNVSDDILELDLDLFSEYKLEIKPFPADAAHQSYKISSSDYMVVNPVGDVLKCISAGTAIITVSNDDNSVRKEIEVRIIKKKKSMIKLFRRGK